MEKVIIFYKNIGETPLQALERARKERGIDEKTPMTYAGRLDPMAIGILIILVGDECKNKENYLKLDKEYEVEVLFGLETDSHDTLGLIEKVSINSLEFPELIKYIGKANQKYPRYSSKIIGMNKLPEESLEKEIEIFSIDKESEREEKGLNIANEVINNIKKVQGDFRQDKIIGSWNTFKAKFGNNSFKILKIRVKCSSGTYMRVLANNIGKDANTGAIAYSIKRTRIYRQEV